MTKEFKEYLQNTKNEFVTAVHDLNLSPSQRVPMENIIIAFDQCRHKLEAQFQQHGVSGKTTDEEIWQWIQWLDKRCAFTEHQTDYVFFAIRQILKKKACDTAKGEERKE